MATWFPRLGALVGSLLLASACAPGSAARPAVTPEPTRASGPRLVLADGVPTSAADEARAPARDPEREPIAPVALAPALASKPIESRPERQSRRARRALGWVSLGIAGESLLVAVPTSIILLDKKHHLDQQCSADKECSQSGVNEANSFTALTPINTASWVLTVVGAAAGAVLLFTAPPESSRATVAVTPGGVSGTF